MRLVMFDNNNNPMNSIDNDKTKHKDRGKPIFNINTFSKRYKKLTNAQIEEIKILMIVYQDIFFKREETTNKIIKKVEKTGSNLLIDGYGEEIK